MLNSAKSGDALQLHFQELQYVILLSAYTTSDGKCALVQARFQSQRFSLVLTALCGAVGRIAWSPRLRNPFRSRPALGHLLQSRSVLFFSCFDLPGASHLLSRAS